VSQPRWRNARFGGTIEYVRRRPGGGPAIWYGTVEPVIRGNSQYSTPYGCGSTPSEDESKRAVEELASQHQPT
jgi:hypothetical protein